MVFESFLNREPIPEIAALQPNARDNIFLADAEGFAEKLAALPRGHASESYVRGLRKGDLARVRESDELVERLSDQVPHSRTFANTVGVVGALPIVPAYLAGQPMNMRLRTRQKKPAGPLAIFLETTASSGAQGNATLRGAAMLALVRVLNEYRPVDLWVCVTYGQREKMHGLLVRVETRPLDIARSAHMLGNLSETGIVGARLFHSMNLYFAGGWSYGVPELERKWCGQIFGRFLQPGSDVLYVPAAHLSDKLLKDPVSWLKSMLAQYGGETMSEDEGDC